MTTTTIKSIKPAGGGDYTSLNAWATARAANLVTGDLIEIAEVYGGGNAITTQLVLRSIDGWNCDSDHYIEIRAAAGEEHDGVWDTNKAYMQAPYDNYALYATRAIYLYVKKMQLKSVGSNMSTVAVGDGYTPINHYFFDRCIMIRLNDSGTGGAGVFLLFQGYAGYDIIGQITNSILLDLGTTDYRFAVVVSGPPCYLTIYNSALVVRSGSGWNSAIYTATAGGITTQNCYLRGNNAYYRDGGGTYNKGSKDATSNAEATDPNLRNVPYTTATFLNVTTGSENLRLVVSESNKLIDNGANLSGSGVVEDIIGTPRPQLGGYDIGPFENDTPICWNYTAKFKGSKKLFKTSGGGAFPRNLRVPGNVDKSTGKMIDDGVEIDPDHYEVF